MKRLPLTLLALAAALVLSAQVRVPFVGASTTEGAGRVGMDAVAGERLRGLLQHGI